MLKAMSGVQRRVFIGCLVAYFAAYLNRLNLSAALPGLEAGLSLTGAQSGLIHTLFALTYASGQLIMGSLVDRISPRKFMFIGLAVSGALNILLGVVADYRFILVAWCLNGLAQSMLWTPIVKLMAGWYDGELRNQVSFGMSLTLIVGNIAAVLLSGKLSEVISWRYSFIVPGCLAFGFAAATLALIKDPEPEAQEGGHEGGVAARMPLKQLMLGTGLIYVLALCVANGFVRDSIVTWAPTIMSRASARYGSLLAGIVPALSIIGILLCRLLYRVYGNNHRRVIAIMMTMGALMAWLMIVAGGGPAALSAVIMGLCCALMSGMNPLIVTMIPLEYGNAGRVGLVAGMVDCFIYAGSALAGVLVGGINDAYGMDVVCVIWSCVAVLGAISIMMSVRGSRRINEWRTSK